jgi:tetratricopeptide (TPR) repeat protein
MSDSASSTPPFDSVSAKRLLDQFAVSQAADLALSGSYTSAESLLRELIQRSDAPTEALDLLARICAQQGRVVEAAELWRRALDADPANSAYQAAMVRLNRMQQRPVWLTFLWPAVLAVAVVILCFGAFQIQAGRHQAELASLERRIEQASDSAAKVRDVGILSQSVNDLKSQQNDLQAQIQQARGELKVLARTSASIAKTTQDLLAALSHQSSLTPSDFPKAVARNEQAGGSSPLRLDIEIAGVAAIQHGDCWIVQFQEGLFDHDDHFRVGSEALLNSVAESLARSQERIFIEVVGSVVDEARTASSTKAAGREALGLVRAKRVTQFLSGLGLFRLGALRTATEYGQDFDLSFGPATNEFTKYGVVLRISAPEGVTAARTEDLK